MDDMSTPIAPVLPSGRQIYDTIMGGIEPELVSSTIDELNERYKDEPPAQKAERKARYEAAFAEYDVRYKAYIHQLGEQVHEYRRASLRSTEERDRRQEDDVLHSLEESFG